MKIKYVGYGKNLLAMNAGVLGFLIGLGILNPAHNMAEALLLTFGLVTNAIPVTIILLHKESQLNHKEQSSEVKQE